MIQREIAIMWVSGAMLLASHLVVIIVVPVGIVENVSSVGKTVAHLTMSSSIISLVGTVFTIVYFSRIRKSPSQEPLPEGFCQKHKGGPITGGWNLSPMKDVASIAFMGLCSLQSYVFLGIWSMFRYIVDDSVYEDEKTLIDGVFWALFMSRIADIISIVVGHKWAVYKRTCHESKYIDKVDISANNLSL